MADPREIQNSVPQACNESKNITDIVDQLKLTEVNTNVQTNITAVRNVADAMAAAEEAISKFVKGLDEDSKNIIKVANALEAIDRDLAGELEKAFEF